MTSRPGPTHGRQPRRIRFNAFDMNWVVHPSPGLWRHPEDHSRDYTDLRYWTDLAQLLETGYFDGLFLADVLGLYDLYGASPDAALRAAAQVPVNDPLPLVSAMAAMTDNLGFGLTTGTAFEHPFPFARRISTLDHLTDGRLGWNVVTGYLPSAAENTQSRGQLDTFEHDARYDHADEYLEVLYKLWEGSWDQDAVLADPVSGVYTAPAKVRPINHAGTHYTVPGIHVSEPSPQRTPVIFQAGASSRGSTFAADHAEAVFVAAPTKEALASTVRTLTAKLTDAGRSREDVVVYALLTVITDATEDAARANAAEYRSYIDHEVNARSFTEDGFYRTGDIVVFREGTLTVVGRAKGQINRGGEKIAPEAVENILLTHDAVHDVSVVGVPDKVLGEKIRAFVIPRQDAASDPAAHGLTPTKMRKFAREAGLSSFAVPDLIDIVAEFPLTGVGKVSKKAQQW